MMIDGHKSRGFSGLSIDWMMNPLVGMFQLFLIVTLDLCVNRLLNWYYIHCECVTFFKLISLYILSVI
jgi:hypothetical protein